MSVVVREAKLFEAADYRERGISFTEADLDAIVAGFNTETASGLTVPIRVQHGRSPWEGKFGKVVKVWRSGKDLMGSIEWPRVVWEFLCTMGTKSLSVGFDWRSRRLREVSVVDRPRVLTAQAFSGSMPSELMLFSFDIPECSKGGKNMAGEYSPEVEAAIKAAEQRGFANGAADERTKVEAQYAPIAKENADLKRSDAKSAAAVKLAVWKSEGKLLPACEKFAEAILVDGTAEVTFADGGHMSAAEALVQFMTHMVPVVEIPGTKVENNEDKSKFDKDAERLFAELGVTVEEVTAVENGQAIPKPAEKG